MSQYSTLKAAIASVIKQNGNNEITGALLQQALFSAIDSLGAGYQFAGIATPATNPGTPDYNVYYLAYQPGAYSNFGATVGVGQIGVFSYNGSWDNKIISITNVDLIMGYWRDTSGTTLAQSLNESSSYVTALIPVQQGDKFRVASSAGTLAGNFATYDSALTRVRRTVGNNIEEIITIESGESWLVFNASIFQDYALFYFGLSNNFLELRKSVGEITADDEPQPGSNKLLKSGGVKDIDTLIFLYANELNKGLKVGKNLFDKNNMYPYGGFFNANGKFLDSTYATLSNPIRVTPGQHLYANYHSASGQYGKFYGIDGAAISVINFDSNQIVVPANAYYLVLPIQSLNIDRTQIEIGDSATTYEPFSAKNVADDLDEKLELALPDKVGQYTFLKLTNQQQYFASFSNPERISRNGNIITITGTGATYGNYFGIKHSTMFSGINKPAGTKVAVSVRAKVVGDLDNLIISVGSYPVYSTKPTNSKLFKDNGQFIGVAFVTIPESITDGQFYISFGCESGFSTETTITIQSWGFSILDSDENNLTKQIEELVSRSIPDGQIQNIAITCKRNGTSGIDADYCGLTAISDALNAITDASYFKRYTLIIDGIFEFTDPLTIPMPDRNNVEHSIINCKPYVSFQGMGVDRTILFVNIPAGATFHDGRSYADYQPVYLYCDGEVNFSNMSILGKNCRYAFHLEAGSVPNNTIRNIKNCRVIHYGLDGYQSQGFEHAFGCGMGNGHIWNIENCYVQSGSAAFAIHSVSAVSNIDKFPQGKCNIKNCELNGNIYAGNGQVPGVCQVNFDNCIINNQTLSITTSSVGSTEKVNSDYSNIKMWFNTPALPIHQNFSTPKGLALRIDGLLDNSTIRFDETASAFNDLIGINQLYNPIFTELALYEMNGYRYRDGGVGLKGFAYGLKDATNNNLAKSLGDCSTTPKSLKINISGTNYTVVFNSNYTNLTNADVVDAINAVIGTVATASIYYPIKDYYPHFKDLEFKVNTESDAPILRGMAVYFTGQGIRRSKNSDGFIDGVCLDDIAPGQTGRVISSGALYDMSQRATQSVFTILELATTMNQQRAELGISVDNDGYFDRNATPKVVKCIKNGVVKLNGASI